MSRYIAVPKWSMGTKGISAHGFDVYGDIQTRVFFGEVCPSSFTDSDLVGKDTSLPR